MVRRRLPVKLIQRKRARKTTFERRKNSIMKKVYEFSTLCGVDACVIIYAPNSDGEGPSQPETWPQDTREVHRIIEKYHNTATDKRSKVYDEQEYLKGRIIKVEAEISKARKEKLKMKYPTWDDSFYALGQEQLRMFVSMLDAKLDACNQRINMLKRDLKGKAIAESEKSDTISQNMSQGQLFPPPVKPISDNNPAPFYPLQLDLTLASLNTHHEAAFQSQPGLPHGFQRNGN